MGRDLEVSLTLVAYRRRRRAVVSAGGDDFAWTATFRVVAFFFFSAAVRTETRFPSKTAAIWWMGVAPRSRSSAA